jgi:ABC-type transporter Mla maintaining outer membrane lipid asymmetry ATPase subunit MlaF
VGGDELVGGARVVVVDPPGAMAATVVVVVPAAVVVDVPPAAVVVVVWPGVVVPVVVDEFEGSDVVVVDGVVKRYGADTVLDGVSLSVPTGHATVVIGPSGSGKSTLLRCVARLEAIQRGRILIDGALASTGTEMQGKNGDEVPKRDLRHEVGMVFQLHCLFEHLSVLDNVMLGRHARRPSAACARIVPCVSANRILSADMRASVSRLPARGTPDS